MEVEMKEVEMIEMEEVMEVIDQVEVKELDQVEVKELDQVEMKRLTSQMTSNKDTYHFDHEEMLISQTVSHYHLLVLLLN